MALFIGEIRGQPDAEDILRQLGAQHPGTQGDPIGVIMQAAHPVLWDESVRNMIADGADLMIEAGPGTVLSGFMKRISRRTRTLHAEDTETIENVLTSLEAE